VETGILPRSSMNPSQIEENLRVGLDFPSASDTFPLCNKKMNSTLKKPVLLHEVSYSTYNKKLDYFGTQIKGVQFTTPTSTNINLNMQ
jgi:hypothetical protein